MNAMEAPGVTMRRLVLVVLLVVAPSAASWSHPQTIPARIVSTSPSITETLFALGLGDRVVGVSTYCRYPPAVATLLRPHGAREADGPLGAEGPTGPAAFVDTAGASGGVSPGGLSV